MEETKATASDRSVTTVRFVTDYRHPHAVARSRQQLLDGIPRTRREAVRAVVDEAGERMSPELYATFVTSLALGPRRTQPVSLFSFQASLTRVANEAAGRGDALAADAFRAMETYTGRVRLALEETDDIPQPVHDEDDRVLHRLRCGHSKYDGWV
jgi:hypothetical protein